MEIKNNLQKFNLYKKNRKSLSFIPQIFSAMVVLFIITFSIWYFKSGHNSFVEDNSAEVGTPKDLVKDDLDIAVNDLQNPGKTKKVDNSGKIHIVDKNNQECFLAYNAVKPEKIERIIQKDVEGWWSSENCFDKNLIALQIVRLNTQEIQDLSNLSTSLKSENLQLLDQENNTFAIVYTDQSIATIYNFQKYLKPLVEPVFKDKEYIGQQNIYDSKYVSDYTYYLEGNCQKTNQNNFCNLWRSNNYTNETELLKQNIFSLEKLDVELKENYIIKFAKTQDFPGGVNLILYNPKESYPGIKLFNLDLVSLNIVQFLPYYPSTQEYDTYYR